MNFKTIEMTKQKEVPKEDLKVPVKKVLGDVYTPRVGDKATINITSGHVYNDVDVIAWGLESWGSYWVIIDKVNEVDLGEYTSTRQYINLSNITSFTFERKVVPFKKETGKERLEVSTEPRMVKSNQVPIISERDQVNRVKELAQKVEERKNKEIEMLRSKLNNPERKFYGTTYKSPSFKKRV